MKNFRDRIAALAVGLLLGTATLAIAATFTKFSPATGILKGDATTYVTTAASSSDLLTVIGTVPVANGGTNLTSSTDDNTMVGNGTTWQSKALPACTDTGGSHLNYDTSTNTFSCGTSVGTTGTFTASFTTGYTVTQTQDFKWAKVGNIVTLAPTSEMTGTSNATNLTTASGAAPSNIRPSGITATVSSTISGTNNGAGTALCMRIGTDGTMSYGVATPASATCNFGGFTASGTKAALQSGALNAYAYGTQ